MSQHLISESSQRSTHRPARRAASSRWPNILLALGAAAGALLAASGLLQGGGTGLPQLPAGAVARVNGETIRLDEYQQAVNGLAQDRRSINADQRQMVLDRLIDEELLLQRALELGLARDDVRVRRTLTAALIESVVSTGDSATPDDAELRSFYNRERDFFSVPGKVRVRQIWVKAGNPAEAEAARNRAQQAAERLRNGEDMDTVRQNLGDPELVPLPDVLLPVQKLGDYLGPTAIRAILSQPEGVISDPIRSNTGYHVLVVVERAAAEPPAFDAIKAQVLVEYRRREADRALRKYLDDLRRQAEIVVQPDLP